MKKVIFGTLLLGFLFITGCDTNHNFMDVENENAKEDLQNLIGSGNIPKVDTKNIVPDNLSGKRNEAKGYANKYYEDTLQEYVEEAKDGLSGAKENIKGYYNKGVDELNEAITNKVNGAVSGGLSKYKIK